MKTLLYYFTGTGNSLAAARQLQKNLTDADLMPIAALLRTGDRITVPAGVKAGIVMPMYCGFVPNILHRFFALADFSQAAYVFTLMTEGGTLNANPVTNLAELCRNAGHDLNGSWWIQMPDNYIPLQGAVPQDKQDAMFAAATAKLAEIATAVEAGTTVLEPEKIAGRLMRALAYKPFMTRMETFDTKFTVNAKCTRCQTCVRICPVDNITLAEDGTFTYAHHCEGCLACLQFCPQQAISCGTKTVTRKRYHHPAVTVADMLNQKRLD